jgi:Mg-chelatase subunit ChlD
MKPKSFIRGEGLIPRRPVARLPIAGLGIFLVSVFSLHAQDLTITAADIRIEQRVEGGYHLFIRKKPGINSVLLTESTRDPSMREDNYAYRAPEWNPVNGDETRYLDGAPIAREDQIYSLIDSTPESHPELGEAFHIYIPYILNYGFPATRHGEVYVVDGTYLNIRSFTLPFGDYRGSFRDNPFVLRVVQTRLPGPPEGNYMQDTVRTFREIADSGRGDMVYSKGPEDLVQKIGEILEQERGRTLDLVLCLDTTNSMKDDIDSIRSLLIPMLEDMIPEFSDFRIGMVLYKDYFEEYLNRVIPFTRDLAAVRRSINAIRVSGGRDLPEAVYEALYEATVKFPWEADARLVILIGDAPPHPRPRGRITKDIVESEVAGRGLKVHAIILPQ